MSDDKNHKYADRPGAAPSQPDHGVADDFRQNGKARLIRLAREVIYREEDRPEKVAQLKEAIEQGVYKVDARKLADILIKEWFPKR
jgi:anti-sigma28 factor (negative regulator of flagellin synthesis)